MGVSSQLYAPATLFEVRASGIHCTGGWVDPRAGLDAVAKRKCPFPASAGNRTSVVKTVVPSLH